MIGRRSLLRGTGLAMLGSSALAARPAARAVDIPDTAPIQPFSYGDVDLLDGAARAQRDATLATIAAMPEDDLLRPFRERSGMAAPGAALGGWYDSGGFSPGVTFGQWVSALARHAETADAPAYRAKVARLLDGYAQTIEPSGRFYVDHRFPAYTHDKLVCGLIDAGAHAGYAPAWRVLARATDAALPYLPDKALTRIEQEARPHKNVEFTWDESYTLPENQFLAWRRSGEARYRDLGRRYLLDAELFDPLAAGRNVLPGLHAYSHMNALSSAAQAYLALGDPKHLRAAVNGFAMIRAQSWATGGWGPDERFLEPGGGRLGEKIATAEKGFETPCGAYAHLKLARYLLRITGDSGYGDSMERVMFNTVLGARPLLSDGASFYYSDYRPGAQKRYFGDKWPCCAGTLPQVTTDYAISAYFRDTAGIYVNLYLPSRLRWDQGGVACALEQRTAMPIEGSASLRFASSAPVELAIRLRIPAWATPAAVITINGAPAGVAAPAGGFATLRRRWRDGDRIDIALPMRLTLEPVDAEHPDLVALLRGPLVLHAIGTPPNVSRAALLAAARDPGAPASWHVAAPAGPITLRPFMHIHDEAYTTYLTMV